MIIRALFGLAGLAVLVTAYGGGIVLLVLVGVGAWGWLFPLVPAVVIAAVILTRVGAHLLIRGIDG